MCALAATVDAHGSMATRKSKLRSWRYSAWWAHGKRAVFVFPSLYSVNVCARMDCLRSACSCNTFYFFFIILPNRELSENNKWNGIWSARGTWCAGCRSCFDRFLLLLKGKAEGKVSFDAHPENNSFWCDSSIRNPRTSIRYMLSKAK